MKLHIYAKDIASRTEVEELVQLRVQTMIRKFSALITDITVRLEDLNGPKGGCDIECRVVVNTPLGPLMARERDENAFAAASRACGSAKRSLAKLARARATRRRPAALSY